MMATLPGVSSSDNHIELLFFDTFTHENTEDLNLDLVQFPCAVVVHEVRVIPLGTRVVADFPGGVRLGATNPSSFKLELFVNNLGRPNASTFEKLGLLDYNANVDIQLKLDNRIATDGLIIKGWYQTITLAVYGSVTTVVQSRASPPPPPPPNVKSKLHTIVPIGVEAEDVVGQHLSIAATQRAALERTSDWAEKQATITMHQRDVSPHSSGMASPRGGESPPVVNPREIPLDHRGGSLDQPKDPRERGSEEIVRGSRGEGDMRGEDDWSRHSDLDRDEKLRRKRDRSGSPSHHRSPKRRSKSPETSSLKDEDLLGIGGVEKHADDEGERNDKDSHGGEALDQLLCGLSEGDTQEGGDNFSQISSNEDNLPFEDGLQSNIGEMGEWDADDSWNCGAITSFNPYQCDLAPLETFSDTSLTAYEVEKKNIVLKKDKSLPTSSARLLDIIASFRRQKHHEQWVEAMESVPGLIVPGLVYLINKTDHKDVLDYLIDWTMEGLDLDRAVDQPDPTYKLRHMKMGIALAGALCSCDSYIAFRMLSREVQHKLIDLYTSPHMASSIKLQIITALDQTTNLKEGLDWFIGRHHLQLGKKRPAADVKSEVKTEPEDSENKNKSKDVKQCETNGVVEKPTAYQRVVEIMMGKELARQMVALTSLVRKIHTYEVLVTLMNSVDVFVEGVQASPGFFGKPAGDSQAGLSPHEAGSAADKRSAAAAAGDDDDDDMAGAAVGAALGAGGGSSAAAGRRVKEEDGGSERERKNEGGSDDEMDVDDRVMMDNDSGMILDPALEEEVMVICQCLEEISRVLADVSLIGQQKRMLPSRVKFEVVKSHQQPVHCLYHMFNSCRLLESVFVLLSCPVTCNHSILFGSIKSLLSLLLQSHNSLIYLCSKVETVNGILRTLTQNSDYSQGDERELSAANQLGLTMIYHLQALQHVDQLCEYKNKDIMERELDETEILGVLHSLYTMTFAPQGREAVVHVFTLDDNMSALMTFIQFTGLDMQDNRIRRSVCFSYAVMMITLILHHSHKVDWIEKFGPKILNFADTESKQQQMKADEKVVEIMEWLQPIKTISVFNSDSSIVLELVNQLKTYTEEFKDVKQVTDLPKGMITVLRVLRHLSIEETSEYPPDEFKSQELKYRYVLFWMHGANVLPLFITILQKVKDIMLFPWQIGFPQTTTERSIVLSVVQLVLSMMRAILSNMISARGTQYKDVTHISSLMDMHTILCSVTPTGVLTPDLQIIQTEIVDTLMAYTEPHLHTEPAEDDVVGDSLWSSMLKEVLKYTMIAPYTHLSGLILLSEMLPLPLPIQSKETIEASELSALVNFRQQWSTYLNPHFPEILNIIRCLAGTSCQPLHQLLRRVCWQLADLAVPAALAIVRSMLDTLLENMDSDMSMMDTRRAEAKESGYQSVSFSRTPTARILNLFAFLMNQAAVKAAFLFLPRSGVKSDEKYVNILQRLIDLFNVVSDAVTDMQTQESIVSIFQSLCDVEINLIVTDGRLTAQEVMQRLSNGLPSNDQLSQISVGLLKHIDNRDQKFSSVLPSLRTLTLLMDHDYGFYYVKRAMEMVPSAFFNLFLGINATFSKDSSDCLATLSSAAECIQFLVSPPLVAPPEEEPAGSLLGESSGTGPSESAGTVPSDSAGAVSAELNEAGLAGVMSPYDRKLTMSCAQIRKLLSWTGDSAHPLYELDMLLCEYAKDEETLKAVYESMHAVVTMLQSDDHSQKPAMKEPVMPAAESLTVQFGERTVYLITGEEDDRLSATYWLSTPMGDESENEQDLVKTNLMEIASKFCPGLDLEAELKKGSTTSDVSALPKRKKHLTTTRRNIDMINTSRQHGSGGFVAPMRGRGFGRGGGGGMGGGGAGRSDMFRSRPPNTSRPPSMHVDDFNKIEQQHHGPPGPGAFMQPGPGMNTPQRHPEEAGRGQMFDRGGNFGRGRFFGSAGNYGHRDGMSRGGYGGARGGVVMHQSSPRGGMMVRGTATGPPMMGGGGGPKPVGQWGSRVNQRPMYGSGGASMSQNSGFGPSGMGGPGMPNAMDRMDRRRDVGGGWGYGGGWQDHKERQPDQRYGSHAVYRQF